jgi:hypothetical protein
MSDSEIQSLSGQLNALPAGGISSWWIGALVVAVILVVVFGWWQPGPKR